MNQNFIEISKSENMINTLAISAIIIGISLVLCNYYKSYELYGSLPPTQYLWKAGVPKSQYFNVLNSNDSKWTPPNMVGFNDLISKTEYNESRDNDYGENYRPGDWNKDGYVASLINQYPNTTSGSVNGLINEGYTNTNINNVLGSINSYEGDTPGSATRLFDPDNFDFKISSEGYVDRDINTVLGNVTSYEENSPGVATRLSDTINFDSQIGSEGYIPSMASSWRKQINRLMSMEDQNYNMSERFVPNFSKGTADQRSNIYYAERGKEEDYLAVINKSYGQQLNKLMSLEDQNYYLGIDGIPKEISIITPVRKLSKKIITPISKVTNVKNGAKIVAPTKKLISNEKLSNIKLPNSLTSDRKKMTTEEGKTTFESMIN